MYQLAKNVHRILQRDHVNSSKSNNELTDFFFCKIFNLNKLLSMFEWSSNGRPSRTHIYSIFKKVYLFMNNNKTF